MVLSLKKFSLFLGLVLVLLAFTVFAKAAPITFDCSSAFDCSVESYCPSNSVQGLAVYQGTCGPDGESPCDYYFDSSLTGNSSCSVKVNSTGFGNASGRELQNNEVVSVSINGTVIGTTVDKYANTSDPQNTVFCGTDTQTFTGNVNLNSSNNKLTINGQDSHTVSSVVVDCNQSSNDSNSNGSGNGSTNPCANNLSPVIEDFENKTIKYTELFNYDLWDFVDDYDSSLAEVTISKSVSGNSISCSLESNRFLKCKATTNFGTSTVTISAKDSCGAVTKKSFTVNVTNSQPTLNIPDLQKSCADGGTTINLIPYSWDENESSLNYSVHSESNPDLVDCNVNGKNLVCLINSCRESCSEITLRVFDEFGLSREDSFNFCVKNFVPEWKSIPSQCINETKTKFINLANFVLDKEDKNNLSFSITNQSNSNAVNCSIADKNFVSCELKTNQHSINTLTIRAADSNGKYADTTATISTNCFDSNGNDSNSDDNKRIYFEAEQNSFCLESCTTKSTKIKLSNFSGTRKCFNFDAESFPYNLLNVSVASNNVCLNNNEVTWVTLSANTCGVENRAYRVNLFEVDSNLNLWFDFSVGACNSFDGFRINEFDGKICKGKESKLTVLVRNASAEKKRIYLSADNSLILPYFEKSFVDLSSGEEKAVQLIVNARNLAEDYYYLSLSGDAENYHIEKRLEVQVVNCVDIPKRTFSLSVPSVCFDVKKGQKLESQFTILRQSVPGDECYRDEKNFFLGIYGMPAELSFSKVSLLENQSKVINYSVTVPKDSPAGIQLLTVIGSDGEEWNSFSEQKNICLNVLGEQNAGLVIKTQSKDIQWCGTEVFELELQNTGDFDANYSLSSAEVPLGVSISFSEQKVVLKKGGSKIIFVAVSTNSFAEAKDNQRFKVIVNGPVQLSAWVYFNVKDKTILDDLEIVSSAKQINLKGNSSATFELMIRNNSDRTISNVVVYADNLPEKVSVDRIAVGEIFPGEVVTVKGKIISGDTNGYYDSYYVVSSGNGANKKKFYLNIEYNPKQGSSFTGYFSGLFSGFFTLGEINFGELTLEGIVISVFLAVFLIVIVFFIVFFVNIVTKPKRKESWMVD